MQNTISKWYGRYQQLIHLIIWGGLTFWCFYQATLRINGVVEIPFIYPLALYLTFAGILSISFFVAFFHLFGSIRKLLRSEIPTIHANWYTFPLRPLLERFHKLVEQQRPFIEQNQIHLQALQDQAAQEARNKLAQDLHDSIKQQIFSIQMSAAAVEARFDHDQAGAKQAISDIRQSSHEALVEMGVLLDELAPQAFATIGLEEAIRKQAEALGYRTGAKVNCNIDQLPAEAHFPAGAKENIFRIVQETFSNIARHARAKTVTVTLKMVQDQLFLSIDDDGLGFDKSALKESGRGLKNIQQRIELFGGSANIQSTPAEGTHVSVWLPLINLQVVDQAPSDSQTYPLSRQFTVALLGTVLLVVLLRYPLFVAFPATVIPSWLTASDNISNPLVLMSITLAVLASIGIGAATAWLSPRETRQQNGLAGGANTALAGIVTWLIIGSPAAGLWGHKIFVQFGSEPNINEYLFLELASESILLSAVAIVASFWISATISWVAGFMGGLLINSSKNRIKNKQQATLSRLILSFQALYTATLALLASVLIFSRVAPLDQEIVRIIEEIQANSSLSLGMTLSPAAFVWSERLTQLAILVGFSFNMFLQNKRAIQSRQFELVDLARQYAMWSTIILGASAILLNIIHPYSWTLGSQLMLISLISLVGMFGWQTWQARNQSSSLNLAGRSSENITVNRGFIFTASLEAILLTVIGIFFIMYVSETVIYFILFEPSKVSQYSILPFLPLILISLFLFGGLLYWRRFDNRNSKNNTGFQLSSWANVARISSTDTILPKTLINIVVTLVHAPLAVTFLILTTSSTELLSEGQGANLSNFNPSWFIDAVLANYQYHLLGVICFFVLSFIAVSGGYMLRRVIQRGRVNFLPEGIQGGE